MRFEEPKYTLPNQLPLQMPRHLKMENDIDLFIIDDPKDDAIKLDIEWAAGTKYQDKKLIASFTNKLLLSGDDLVTGSEIAEKIDGLGGYFQQEIDRDHAGVSLFGLKENMEAIWDVFTESFMNCTFPIDELEKERAIALSKFQISSKKVKQQCLRTFNKTLFGPTSPYGQVAEEEDFLGIDQIDLQAFFKRHYLNGKPTLFLVGNVSDGLIQRIKKWSELMVSTPQEFKVPAIQTSLSQVKVEVPNAVQTAIRMGRLMIDKSHPDYFKVQLLNTLLGGYFGSRLMSNIREDKGYTYGIGSAISVMEDAACFFIATEVGTDVTEQTLTEIKKELMRLQNELIPEEELTIVKNYMAGDFLRHADGAIAQMENFKNIHFNQLSPNYYSNYLAAINQATAEELKVLAATYFDPSQMLIVTAGA